MVHEVGLAGDGAGREGERLDAVGLGEGRRQPAGPVRVVVVDVVGEPHRDAAVVGVAQRPGHGVADGAREPHVVEREVERAPGGGQEGPHRLADLLGALAALDQGADGDRHRDGR